MGLRALVIEDIEEQRATVASILQDLSFSVAEIGNGADALDYLQRTTPPDLIVSDLMMPVLNGWDFISHIRRIKGLREVPIIVVSAASLNRETQGRVHAFLSKPFRLEQFEETVMRLFDLKLPPKCEVIELHQERRQVS